MCRKIICCIIIRSLEARYLYGVVEYYSNYSKKAKREPLLHCLTKRSTWEPSLPQNIQLLAEKLQNGRGPNRLHCGHFKLIWVTIVCHLLAKVVRTDKTSNSWSSSLKPQSHFKYKISAPLGRLLQGSAGFSWHKLINKNYVATSKAAKFRRRSHKITV